MSEKLAEALKLLASNMGASYDTFYRAHQDGRLKTIRLGNRLFVPRDEIDRILREGLPRQKGK